MKRRLQSGGYCRTVFRLSRKTLFFIVFLTLCLATLHLSAGPVQAEEAANAHIYGRVVDNATRKFIPDAYVILRNSNSGYDITSKTNASGIYEVKAIDQGHYDIYAYYDNQSTKGFDYIPAYRNASVEELPVNVSFTLLPGVIESAEEEFRPFGFPLLRSAALSDSMRKLLQSLQARTYTAEETGFYVFYEDIKLSLAEGLVENAYMAWAEGDYDKAYADFHEAYLILDDLGRALTSMHANATKSAFFITLLLGFTAVAVAAVLLDDRRHRLALSLGLYGILFGLLYFLYPGYHTLEKTVHSIWAGTALEVFAIPLLVMGPFIFAFLVVNWLPYRFKEETVTERLALSSALIAAFSVAARNLRRRRLRTSLSSIFILILVFSFIALTSFSPEHGFHIQPQPGQAASEGFLIRRPPVVDPSFPYISSPFEPIEPSLPQWLEERPETTLVVPLIENTPQVGTDEPPPPLTILTVPQKSLKFDVTGVLGVFPSREVNATGLDSVITQGQFLKDTDFNGVLISEEAAEELQVEANDSLELYGRLFRVIGVFSSEKLGGLNDWNGEPLVPQRVIEYTNDGPDYWIEYVPVGGVVIVHQQTAQIFPEMVISRVDVQTRSPEDDMALARITVLTWSNVEAFAYVDGKIHHLSIGSHYMTEGFANVMVLLVLAVLNVGVTMMGAVYERKREVVTMSCVGLNPSNITAVFLAEALVIGVVAGSLGYLLGLVSYRFMVMFAVSMGMKQKVEAGWGILALSLSIAAAALGSALPATKASIITTPSLRRKFDITPEEKPQTAGEPWLFNLPIQIREEELEGFFDFMEKRLRDYTRFTLEGVRDVKLFKEEAEPTATRLSFTYFYLDYAIITDNQMFPVEGPLPNQYSVRLASKARRGATAQRGETDVRRTAALIRHLTLEYTIKTRENPGKSTPSNQD